MKYVVKIPQFEGPFDLLLDLISKQKIEITEIKIGPITDDYLNAIQKMQELDIHLASDFLRVAGHLLHLKSKTLIPSSPDWDGVYNDYFEDEMELFEDEEDLKQRLLEYRVYKDAATRLMELEEIRKLSYERGGIEKVKSFNFISKEEFIRISAEIMQLMMETDDDFFIDDFDTIYMDEITVEEKIDFILDILKSGDNFRRFSDLLTEKKSKIEIVATFLALLELTKMGRVVLIQEDNFQDIIVQLEDNGEMQS
jgi:segregation and condensation protein A